MSADGLLGPLARLVAAWDALSASEREPLVASPLEAVVDEARGMLRAPDTGPRGAPGRPEAWAVERYELALIDGAAYLAALDAEAGPVPPDVAREADALPRPASGGDLVEAATADSAADFERLVEVLTGPWPGDEPEAGVGPDDAVSRARGSLRAWAEPGTGEVRARLRREEAEAVARRVLGVRRLGRDGHAALLGWLEGTAPGVAEVARATEPVLEPEGVLAYVVAPDARWGGVHPLAWMAAGGDPGEVAAAALADAEARGRRLRP
ncbi:MAG: hypothetical protein U0838_00710 [Chloroflexota bacterium]